MRVYIVSSQKDPQHSIVFYLDDNAEKLPKTPRGYKKPRRGMTVKDCSRLFEEVTNEEHKRIVKAYDRVIDLREKNVK